MTTVRIGLLLFPRLTQLDLTGPFEVFAKLPDASVHLVWKTHEPVTAETGLRMLPDTTLAECPPLDVLCVPGGPGVSAMMEDAEVIAFLREQARGARFVASVCTGALVLGAAGLLHGKHATTHWASHDLLSAFGAIPTKGRVVRDGNLTTCGGVTAGIDFALTVAAEIAGPVVAQAIQLQIEYAPEPPFDAGSHETAPPDVLSIVRQRNAPTRTAREELVARIARTIAL
jgi:cyclohexyl-isocyanide hydratase